MNISMRRIDKVGKINLPKKFLDKVGITSNNYVEIHLNSNNNIEVSLFKNKCIFCGSELNLIKKKEKYICKECMTNILSIF